MFEDVKNLELLDIYITESGPQLHRLYKDRASHAFVFKICGATGYVFSGTPLTLNTDEILFIPKGSTYDASRIIHGKSLIINFNADFSADKPQKFFADGFPDKDFLVNDLVKLWLFGSQSEKYKCLSVFYSMLAFISEIEKSPYALKKHFYKIEPAVNYLHAHIFDCDLKVTELHLLCGISDTYFRKIFRVNFGVNPLTYIINKRMAQACAIIGNADYNSIGDVALSVGYADSLYFSRIFSKKYGVCPSEYTP